MNKLKIYRLMEKFSYVILIVSLVGIFNYHNLIPCISVYWEIHANSPLENIWYDISLGLFTGAIVYIFTVIIPQKRRNIIVQPLICTEIRDLENSYRIQLIHLNSDNTNGSCTTAKALLQGFKENCKENCKCKNAESIYFSDEQKNIFSQIINLFKTHLPAILKYEQYLSDEQIEILLDIQNSPMHNCLKNNVSNSLRNGEHLGDVNLMAESMEDVFNKCHTLYKSIDKIAFDNKISFYKNK